MTTRLVSIDQIAADVFSTVPTWVTRVAERLAREGERLPPIYVIQVADPTGGDVFKPKAATDEAILEGLRRAKWPHPVQVEVVNG